MRVVVNSRPPVLAPICLVLGALLGIAGTFVPPPLRGLAWAVDGVALVTAGALLVVHYLRQNEDLLAGGFVVFTIGQALVLSGAAMSIDASVPSFAAGAALWAVSLAMISTPGVMPLPVRVLGFVACALFALMSMQVFAGHALTPLSEPLPLFAYPVLVATMLGWAWSCRLPPNVAASENSNSA
jgi:hypothetical protein